MKAPWCLNSEATRQYPSWPARISKQWEPTTARQQRTPQQRKMYLASQGHHRSPNTELPRLEYLESIKRRSTPQKRRVQIIKCWASCTRILPTKYKDSHLPGNVDVPQLAPHPETARCTRLGTRGYMHRQLSTTAKFILKKAACTYAGWRRIRKLYFSAPYWTKVATCTGGTTTARKFMPRNSKCVKYLHLEPIFIEAPHH
jgi:hypothetical protein